MLKKIEINAYVRSPFWLECNNENDYKIEKIQIKYTLKQCIKKIKFKGPLCYGVFVGSKMIHACYLYKSIYINYLLGYRGYSVIGDCFTTIEYRGKGLYPKTISRITKESKCNIVIYVERSNASSIRGVEKAGYVLDKRFILYKLLILPVYGKVIHSIS